MSSRGTLTGVWTCSARSQTEISECQRMPWFCKDKTVIVMLMNKLLLSLNPSKSYKRMYSVSRQIECIKQGSGNPNLQLNAISSWEQFFNKRAAIVPRTCQQLQLQLENSRLYFSVLICCLKHNPENFRSKKVKKTWCWVCQWSEANIRELEAVFWQYIHKIFYFSTLPWLCFLYLHQKIQRIKYVDSFHCSGFQKM